MDDLGETVSMNAAASQSIRFRIVALTILIIAPLLVVFTIVSISLASAHRSAIELRRQHAAHELSAIVDRDYVELRGILTGIALTLSARLTPNVAFNEQLAVKVKSAHILGLWSFAADGHVTEQFMDALPDVPNHTLTPDTIARIFKGQSVASEVLGEGLDKATVAIAVPIFDENNVVVAGLAAEVGASVFEHAFDEAGMNTTWVAAVVDREGNFVARSSDAEKRVGTKARPQLGTIAAGHNESGSFENVTLEGTPVLNSFKRSSVTRWISVVAVPAEELAAPMRRTLTFDLLGGLAALGLSLLAARVMAARIAQPVINLSRYATALADGETIENETYKITEIEEVRASLNSAMAKSARLAALVAASGDAIIGMGMDDTIQAWNKGAEGLFGYTEAEVIGQPNLILVPPDLQLQFDAQRKRVSSREVVRTESVRVKKNGERVDVEVVVAPIINVFGDMTGYSSTLRDITERIASRDHRQLLILELAHRTKNQLAIIQSIAQQTKRNSTTLEGFITTFNGRIQGLSASHDILAKQQWRAIPVIDLVKSQVAVLVSDLDKVIRISGPDIALTATHAEALGLALHELTTNSIKYGALKSTKGRVAISWRLTTGADSVVHVHFSWQETGGPKIRHQPSGEGFGSRVLNKMVSLSLGGETRSDFRPEGLYWHATWTLNS